MLPATLEEQRRLYDLQQVDVAVRQLEHRRANLAEQRALDETNETLRRIAHEYATSKERLEELQRQQSRHEQEIAAIDSRRKTEEGRMYSGVINSEKEHEALRNELASLRSRKRDLEDALLEIMEEQEQLESSVESLKQRHTDLNGKIGELESARDAAATDIDAELNERRAERDKIAAELPEEIRDYYEELKTRKQDIAVAALQGTVCAGCRLQLTPTELEEVEERVARGLAKCPQCDRIVVTVAGGQGAE